MGWVGCEFDGLG